MEPWESISWKRAPKKIHLKKLEKGNFENIDQNQTIEITLY